MIFYLKTPVIYCLLFFIDILVVRAQFDVHQSQYNWYNDYDISFYKIDLTASDTSRYIEGNASILSKSTINKLDTFIFELGQHLAIDSILFDAKKVSYNRAGDLVKVSVPVPVGKGQFMMVSIYYKGNVPNNGFFSGLSNKKDYYWQVAVTWSLSESFRAKDWFPCKQYLPDKADSVWVFITVPNNRKVGSNGLLKSIVPVGPNKLRYEWKTNYPIAYYLISFTIGDYQDYSYYLPLNDHDSLLIQNYIYNKPGYLSKNKHLIDATGEYLTYYSSLFGSYPFMKEKYGHCVAPIQGGMEHQTMTTLVNFELTLVAHELAHQWFGDLVTCQNWQDIWIHEGFASYGEFLTLDKFETHQAANNWMDFAHSCAMQDSLGTVYIPDDDKYNELRIFNFNLTYKKGAAIIHQLRYELNDDELFFSILRQFLKKYAYSVATCNDFKNMVTQVSGENYSWFFDQWYYGKGYPEFEFYWYQKKDTLYISSRQNTSSSDNNLFKMHMDMQLKFNGNDTTIRLYQDQKTLLYKIPVKNTVDKIIVDPEHWCLLKVSGITKVARFRNAYYEKYRY